MKKTDEKSVNPVGMLPDEVLRLMGVPVHVAAHDYAILALPMVIERTPMTVIYRRVAAMAYTSPWAVERAFRHACGMSADRLGYDGLYHLYGNALPPSGVPTTAQFLVTAARLSYGMAPFMRPKFE